MTSTDRGEGSGMTSIEDAADFFEAFVEPAWTAAPASDPAGPDPVGRPGAGTPPAATMLPVVARRGPRRRTLAVALAAVFVITAVATALLLRRGDEGDGLASGGTSVTGAASTVATVPTADAPAGPTATRVTAVPAVTVPATVGVVLSGGRIVLDGAVTSSEQHDALVVGVRQLAGAGVEVDDRLTVVDGGGRPAAVTIVVRVDDGVLFDVDSAAIEPGFQQLLGAVVAVLRLAPHASAVIVGHSDATGDELTNQALSEARADAVAAYLVANGISGERVRAEGRGSQEPVAGNDTVEGRRANRRIEIQIEQ